MKTTGKLKEEHNPVRFLPDGKTTSFHPPVQTKPENSLKMAGLSYFFLPGPLFYVLAIRGSII